MHILVEKTDNVATNRPFYSPGTIIDVDRLKMEDYSEIYRRVFHKINKYILAMQAEDFNKADRLCQEVFDVQDIVELRFAWSVMTLTTLPMICSSYPDTVSCETSEMLNDENTIGKLSSPEEMKSWVIECHQRLCEKIRLHKVDRSCDLVSQVNTVVEHNYNDPDLNGYGSFKWAFNYPEKFASAGSFGGALDMVNVVKTSHLHNGKLDRDFMLAFGSLENLEHSVNDDMYMAENQAKSGIELPKLFISVGKDDFTYTRNVEAKNKLLDMGYDVTWDTGEGTHSYGYCDSRIRAFLDWVGVKGTPIYNMEG